MLACYFSVKVMWMIYVGLCFSVLQYSLTSAEDAQSTWRILQLHVQEILVLPAISTMYHPADCFQLLQLSWTQSVHSPLIHKMTLNQRIEALRMAIQMLSILEHLHAMFALWKYSRYQQVSLEFAFSLSFIRRCQHFLLYSLLQLVDLPAFSYFWRQFCCTSSQSVTSLRWHWTRTLESIQRQRIRSSFARRYTDSRPMMSLCLTCLVCLHLYGFMESRCLSTATCSLIAAISSSCSSTPTHLSGK